MKNETMGVTELALAPESKKNESAVASADLANTAITMSTFTEEKKPTMVKRLAEIPALRGKDRKVYRMSDGSEQAVFSPAFNTTLDDEERHTSDAQPTIVEDEDGKHYTCAGKHFRAKFSRGDNDELFSIEEGVHKVTVLAEAGDRYRHAKPHLHKRAKHETKIDTLIFDEVIPDTDYEYSVKKRGVKENIVIRKPASAYRYPFLLNCENVAACMDKSAKRIAFLSTETGEEIFHIPAPFMVDAMGVISTAVDYEMREMRDGAFLLTVVADAEWMNAEERAFPVTIDPQIDVSGIYDMEMYSWVDGVMSEASSHTIGITENDDGELSVNRMYMSFTMPKLPRNPRIKKAELLLNQIEATVEKAPAPLFGLYHVTGELCPGDCTPSAVADLIDYAKMYQCEDGTACYTFDVTTLVDMLKCGESASPQFVLKLADETIAPHNYITIGGGSDSRYSPWLVITYESSYGVNTSYRTHTHDLGRFGQGSVDLQRGNLMFESVDFAWSGNKMPVTIKHLFNSALSGYMYTNNSSIDLNTAYFTSVQIGYGFKLNIMQSMMHLDEPPIEWTAEELEEENREYDGYVYIGENGEEIYFKESSRCTRLDSNGQCYKLYEDVGGSDMLYDPVKRSLTQGDETYNFDIFGRLVEIADANNNSMKITYMDNLITSVTDGAGRVFRFTYDADTKLLLYISAPDGTRVSYGYTNNLLSHITYPTGEKASIAYAWNRPQSVTLQDKDYKVVYKVAYTYDSTRLASVTEYGADGTVGAKTSYAYSVASGRTIATTTEPKDSAEGEAANNVITTTYTFDDDGNLVSEYVYSTDTGNVGSVGEESGINPHSGDGGAGVVSNINNLLTGHNFESLAAWLEMPSNCGELTISNYAYEPYTKFGKKVLRMQSYNADCTDNGVYQVTNTLPKGQYTFSAYLRVLSAFSGTNAGAFIRVTDTSGNVLGVSEHLAKYDSEYTRLIVPFELDTAQSVQVQIVVNGKGTIYADAAQLENNPYANAYNMLENGNFERGIEGWTPSTDVSYSTGTRFNMSRSL